MKTPVGTLDRLAGLAGIEESYWDIFGGLHQTTTKAKLSILSAMGFGVGSKNAIAQALKELEDGPWRKILDPVYVVRLNEGHITVRVSLPERLIGKAIEWKVDLEDGGQVSGSFTPSNGELTERRNIDSETFARFKLPLAGAIGEGYHHLEARTAGKTAKSALIAAPPAAYAPDWLKQGRRLWGVAFHLYSLRSKANWGIGDFSDLAALGSVTAGLGGAAVGLNPLHALFPPDPDQASPYSPSSREFLNPLYIDPAREPEFKDNREVLALAGSDGFARRLARARESELVDYRLVSAIKMAVLVRMHSFFAERHPPGSSDPRRAGFDAFVGQGGQSLYRFTLFNALHEHFEGRPWPGWPKSYRRPDAKGAAAFAKANQPRLEFHAYLQWLAEGQLAAAGHDMKEGMEVGLYMDLAVGADPNGADAWAEPEAMVLGVRFGAPPDAFNAQGQDWGMPPFHPLRLKQMAYRPLIAMLRANMRHAGALRIDHVMGLMRLYWIPPGEKASSGAYVGYPLDDLLGVLALESVRNRCLVIGEDLGTVPDGFRQRMAQEGILSYRVLRFERHKDGLFRRPGAYPALSLSTSATHDLATIKGHWLGRGLELRRDLGLYRTGEKRRAGEAAHLQELKLLVAALKDQGLVGEDFPEVNGNDDETARRLIVAVERFLARTPSQLLNINLDDLLEEADQLNLPGTVTEYPNWRRKYSAALEGLAQIPFVNEVIEAVKSER